MTRTIFSALALLFAMHLQAQQDFDDTQVQTLQVRDNIYMLVGAGGNVTVQTGAEGVLVIDSQYAEMSDKLLAAIRELSDGDIRYLINTHHHPDHIGGNAMIAAAGRTLAGGNVGGDISDAGQGAQIIAHENAVLRMVEQGIPSDAWPTLTYFTDERQMHFNGDGLRIMHQPNAHTDNDSIIFFRQADVVVAGDVYGTTRYPYIDLAAGGNIQGLVAAANTLVDLMIPVYGQDGGTLVIPGHGRLGDIGDVINWREMLTIIRDRIQDMVDRGMSLEEVQAARPTRDYDPRWGADSGFWTTEQFVAAIYQNLSE